MGQPKFFQAVLVEVKEDIIDHVYPQLKNHPNKPTLNDRLPEGKCEHCGGNEWILLPKEGVAVREGGKPYIECLNCGEVTHL